MCSSTNIQTRLQKGVGLYCRVINENVFLALNGVTTYICVVFIRKQFQVYNLKINRNNIYMSFQKVAQNYTGPSQPKLSYFKDFKKPSMLARQEQEA